ncbi:MAG: tRNA (adenosine(37)-N6)-threonylcarbamoyltransferase complex transferase subunit TsaD [Chloroflexi bacterium]|nr:tRNA (adenosine(37)-N6)-threonylcarbamoyltransferase complex transferase subunit TsaD [Chloroflexota bacterium]|tara:strand:+ start:3088 stop:4119 length:1032 start_codon:yes stop_codon:yes gene_type:complete
MKILGIETSCDDTAVGIVEDGRNIITNIVFSQADMHSEFGGIIPEVASREHIVKIVPAINKALTEAKMDLKDIDALSVTCGPGLAGSLLIGVNTAKSMAIAAGLPFIGVNHIEGHIYATCLEDVDIRENPGFPLISLVVSGGHTDLILMKGHGDFQIIARSRDDAAGEVFDKVARVLGLGFPGGPEIQKVSVKGSLLKPEFPRPKVKNSMDFSFSGLKTSVVRRAELMGVYPNNSIDNIDQKIADIAKSFQDAIVDTIVRNTIGAVKKYKAKGLIIGGGVAANKLLRDVFAKESPIDLFIPRPSLCTDNGAMIASAAYFRLKNNLAYQWDLDVYPSLRIDASK